jgi:hypothetical protein
MRLLIAFLKLMWYWVGKPFMCLVCLCRAGYRHLLVALVYMSVCVIFRCKES